MNNRQKKLLEYLGYPLLILSVVSLLLTFVVDSISRGSISQSLNFISSKGNTFLFNALIIFLTLSITLLFKKKTFSYCLISFIWIIAAIGNNVLINLRGTPLTGSDLKLIKSGLTLINNYMSKKEILYIVILYITNVNFYFYLCSKNKV